MKKTIIVTALLACAVQSHAQGQFLYNNILAPIYVGVVGSTLANNNYSVDYIYTLPGSSQNVEGGKMALDADGTFFGGTVTIPNYVGTISLQIRAWLTTDGSTYETANIGGHTGASSVMQVALGDSSAKPAVGATSLKDLSSFAVTASAVPEPSTIALGVMGLSVLLFRRRK